MRVVIVEDSALLRDGLTRLLDDHGHEVTAVADAHTVPSLVAKQAPQLVILDIRLPPTFTDEGLRAAQHIHHTTPETGVLLLSQHVVERYTAELLDGAGGVGYLLKDRVADVREFLDAVHRVGNGGTVLDPYVI
ncbi:response regulator [Pilimelia columellifera]|uniref:Response regulatory domain-containing protein n=1 Tax=Pilimelia columellifera subsp. columellifera TaxID=706583 RepID=A0ABN3NSF5_9ACTN